MNAGTILALYGLFLEIMVAAALSTPSRWSERRVREQRSQHSSIALNLGILWFGILVQAAGLGIPALHGLMVSPVRTWLVLTALICLMSWFIYLALTPTGSTIRVTVQSWLGQSRRNDTSRIPSEIARTLQKKTKLTRMPHETDSEYINRCRDHIVRKLNRGNP